MNLNKRKVKVSPINISSLLEKCEELQSDTQSRKHYNETIQHFSIGLIHLK